MNTFICAGTIVKNGNKIGEVIAVEPKSHIAIMQAMKSIWCESVNNLKVVSYEEVR